MTEPAVEIRFSPEFGGWASCRLTIGATSYETGGVNYTTDPLGDLVRASLMILAAAPRAQLSFDGEPVETRWLLERRWQVRHEWKKGFRVRLLTFPDFYARAREDVGVEQFYAECSATAFATAVLAEANRLLLPENDSWLTVSGLSWTESDTRAAVRALDRALNG